RRRALEEQGIIGLAWDIRKLENDWRSAESLYMGPLANVPLIGDALSAMYEAGTDESGEPVSPFVPAWYLKQVTSPFLGIARFSRSGNWLDVVDGYSDALGSMPLANDLISAYTGLTQTNALLYQRSVEAVNGEVVTDEDINQSMNWLMKAFMNYERIYAEWGFLNTLYNGLDNFQRDPFAMPDVDADGN